MSKRQSIPMNPPNNLHWSGDAKSWYSIQAKGDEAEVMIYDEIGYFGITAKQLVNEINALKVNRITVAINSPGGDVFDGIAIYNALKMHDATIAVRVDGLAASIASIIAMAGDEITMADTAYMMIHNPWSIEVGEADAMRKTADLLDKLTGTLLATYAKRTGGNTEEIQNMMNAETWMTADEAVASGFADSILKTEPMERQTTARAVAYVRNFDRVPKALRERLDLKPVSAAFHGQVSPASAVEVEAATEKETPMNAEAFRKYAAENQDSAEVKSMLAQGHKTGFAEGRQQSKNDLELLAAAFPDDPAFTLKSYVKGRTVDEAKEIKTEIDAATAGAKAEAVASKKLADEAVAKIGEQGALSLKPATAAPESSDPKSRAEYEWDTDPAVRNGVSSKQVYVLARMAELDGSHKTYTREPAKRAN